MARHVVVDLHLRPGHPGSLLVLRHVEHDAAVAPRRDPIFQLQLELAERLLRDDVARALLLAHERPVFDDPARPERFGAVAAECVGRRAVEEQPPAGPALGRGERVGRLVGGDGPRNRGGDHAGGEQYYRPGPGCGSVRGWHGDSHCFSMAIVTGLESAAAVMDIPDVSAEL